MSTSLAFASGKSLGTTDNLSFDGDMITSSTTDIDFVSENLITTGSITASDYVTSNGSIISSIGSIDFNDDHLITTGIGTFKQVGVGIGASVADYSRLRLRHSLSNTIGNLVETDNTSILGSMYFSGVNSSSVYSAGGRIYAIQTDASGVTYIPGVLVMGGSSATTGNWSTLYLSDDDKVGIRVADPTVQLDVLGDGLFTGDLDVTGDTATATFRMTTAPTDGYVMVSDAEGDGTWQYIGTTTYIPDSVTVEFGTPTVDDVTLLQDYDNDPYIITEAGGGSPVLDMVVDFVDVEDLARILARVYYVGSASHHILIQLWKWDDSSWEDYWDFVGQSGYTLINVPILDPTDHIGTGGDLGKVRVKFHHVQSGIASHVLNTDMVWLQDGEFIGSSTNLDGYAKYLFGNNNFSGLGSFMTTGSMSIDSDSSALYLGADQDTSIYFDGTNAIISPNIGDLKLNTNAQGDVTLFEDTDVGDAASGKKLRIHRKAVEGDDSLDLYINPSENAVIEADAILNFRSTTGELRLNNTAEGAVTLFSGSDSGENEKLKQAGYITAAGDEVEAQWQVDDATDNFILSRENANILAFDIQMPLITDDIAADKVQFRDAQIYIESTADGWLNLVADVGVEVNAGILNASAAYVAGTGTFNQILTIPQSSLTCNGDSQGTIMYDSDDDFFYGCDGTDWDKLTN